MKPGTTPMTLKEYFKINHNPGFLEYLFNTFGEKDCVEMGQFWEEEVRKYPSPQFQPGMVEFLKDFTSQGGKFSVISLGYEGMIKKALDEQGLKADYITGFTEDETKRKPAPYPAREALRLMKLKPEDCLLVDDMSPGLEMARTVGVKPCLATWINPVLLEEVEDDVIITPTVSALRQEVFGI